MSSAPVEVTIFFSSISRPGSGVGSEPVAIRTRSVLSTSFLPFSPVTSTSVADFTTAEPVFQSILFFLNRKATPPVSCSTTLALLAIICFRFSFTEPTSMPISFR